MDIEKTITKIKKESGYHDRTGYFYIKWPESMYKEVVNEYNQRTCGRAVSLDAIKVCQKLHNHPDPKEGFIFEGIAHLKDPGAETYKVLVTPA